MQPDAEDQRKIREKLERDAMNTVLAVKLEDVKSMKYQKATSIKQREKSPSK